MNDTERRIVFLVGCIGIRSVFVYMAYKYPNRLYSVPALIFGISFLVLYFGHYRQTGFEATGGKIWWNSIRPVHGFLYLCFAYLCYIQYPQAWSVLAIDVIFGLTAYIIFHTYFN